ncbi:MAG TPA: alpha/beta hydrolase [Gammaproteobacteria bacterium]|jgi:pimeloyl-ACP methyl ester carboxylesterase|nr:alpha/beta hydrolase [Gammaproteobacteria bacterium]
MKPTTIILIPGLLCDAAVWQYQQPTLETIAPVIITNIHDANTPTKMVAAILKNAPTKFALIGHSMGGWIALEIMRKYSERVTHLCLLNTTAKLDSPEKAAAREHLIALAKQGQYDLLIEKLLKAFLYQQCYKEEIKAMLIRNIDNVIKQEHAMQQRTDCVPILKHITCPTLIIHSKQDAIFDETHATLLNQKISHSTFHVLNHCGHMSPIEAREKVTTLLGNFLIWQ